MSIALGVRGTQRRAVAAAAFVAAAAAHGAVRAEDRPVWLALTRSTDAQECPDASRVWQSINTLFPNKRVYASADAEQARERVSISVSKQADGYEAVFSIEGEPTAASRLADPDAQCRGLSDALAVALILRLDPEQDSEAKRPQATPSASPAPPPTPPHEEPPRKPLWVAAEGSALAGAGLLSDFAEPAFGAALGFALNWRGPGLRARGLRLISSPTTVGGGSVHVDLWAAMFGPCWRFALSRRWALDPCVELGLGSQRGVAQGLPVHREATATWLGVAPTLTLLARISGPLWLTMGAGGVVLVSGQRYAVDGQVVTEPARFGPLISLGLSLGWDIRSRP